MLTDIVPETLQSSSLRRASSLPLQALANGDGRRWRSEEQGVGADYE